MSVTAGIILAAGESRRMGTAKPLLKIKGKTFLEHMAQVLQEGGAEPVIVVLGHEAAMIQRAITPGTARIIMNKDYLNGQLSSIQCGIRALDAVACNGVLISPVDIPLITPSLITNIISAAATSQKGIILPVFGGRRGHPGYFSRQFFPRFLDAPPDQGARWVIGQNSSDVLELPTDEEGILLNINTPELYEKYIVSRD